MARKRRADQTPGETSFGGFDVLFHRIVKEAHRGATAEARRFFDSLLSDIKPGDAVDPIPEPYRVLGVLPDAPRWVVEAAYRAWAKELHPDHGGDVKAIQAVNAAVAAIRKVRGWK